MTISPDVEALISTLAKGYGLDADFLADCVLYTFIVRADPNELTLVERASHPDELPSSDSFGTPGMFL
jgi:hypothetical protein